MITSLENSKTLQEMGIEQESEKWWTDEEIVHGFDPDWKVTYARGLYPKAQYIPAYSLSELPSVLKAVGEKRKWTDICFACGLSHFGEEKETSKVLKHPQYPHPEWFNLYIILCEKWATTQDNKQVNDLLEEILKV